MIMDSSKNGGCITPFKKFSRLRVNFFYFCSLSEQQDSHLMLPGSSTFLTLAYWWRVPAMMDWLQWMWVDVCDCGKPHLLILKGQFQNGKIWLAGKILDLYRYCNWSQLIVKKRRDSLMDKVSASQHRVREFEPHMGNNYDSSYDTSTAISSRKQTREWLI